MLAINLLLLSLLVTVTSEALRTSSKSVDVFLPNSTLTTSDGRTFEYSCVKIPSLVYSNSNKILAFGEGRLGSCTDVAPTHLIYRISSDGGISWGDLKLLWEDGDNVIGNVAPVLLGDGDLLAPFMRNNREAWITRSRDDGVTWEDPIITEELVKEDWVWVGYGPPSR